MAGTDDRGRKVMVGPALVRHQEKIARRVRRQPWRRNPGSDSGHHSLPRWAVCGIADGRAWASDTVAKVASYTDASAAGADRDGIRQLRLTVRGNRFQPKTLCTRLRRHLVVLRHDRVTTACLDAACVGTRIP